MAFGLFKNPVLDQDAIDFSLLFHEKLGKLLFGGHIGSHFDFVEMSKHHKITIWTKDGDLVIFWQFKMAQNGCQYGHQKEVYLVFHGITKKKRLHLDQAQGSWTDQNLFIVFKISQMSIWKHFWILKNSRWLPVWLM